MIRFFTRILLISTFFTGLGAMAEGVRKSADSDFVEGAEKQIKVIHSLGSRKPTEIQVRTSSIEDLPQISQPLVQRKVIILRKSEVID